MAKIAILGGGAAGLAAAFELTDPPLMQRHEVTVYEQSWRLGGKGASGRNAQIGDRIEEHGLHVWFGFYANAFDTLSRALGERKGYGHEKECWTFLTDAFTPHDHVTLCTKRGGGWSARRWTFPPETNANNALGCQPGEPIGFDDVLKRAVAFLKRAHEDHDGGDNLFDPGFLLNQIILFLDTDAGEKALRGTLAALRELAGLVPGMNRKVDDYRVVLDVIATLFIGLIDDGLTDQNADWTRANREELSAWLERHGSRIGTREDIAQAPIVKCFYQLCFAYVGGARDAPDLAAGKAIQALLRLAFTYNDRVMWKMNSGMGDTVFTPLYDVLDGRPDASVRFFHRATELVVENGALTKIKLDCGYEQQDDFNPLVKVGELRCWPNAPTVNVGYDPEHEPAPAGCKQVELVQGVDFDVAIVAIPVDALKAIVADDAPFRAALDAVPTVATQALQVWYSTAPPGSLDGREVLGALDGPLDTYSGMDQVADTECFPPGTVAHVAYFCGAMRDEHGETHAQATQRAHDDGLAFLRDTAVSIGLMQEDDDGVIFSALYDPEDRDGEARYESQYWRANTEGTHRYTLTPAGSIEARLRPDESGVEHLFLAGDWTDNGICGGCVEAAVTSGRLAALAVDQLDPDAFPEMPEVLGTEGWLERNGKPKVPHA